MREYAYIPNLQLVPASRNTATTGEEAFPTDGTPADQLKYLVRYAVLAPSSLNSQPWLFTIRGGTLSLFADRTRALHVVDPNHRELTISCGAALFFLRTAIRHFGYQDIVQAFPDPCNDDLLARVRLGPGKQPSYEDEQLFYAIFTRRTTRLPFDRRELPEGLLTALMDSARQEGAYLKIVRSQESRRKLADLVVAAERQQWSDNAFRRELSTWIRSNADNAQDGVPGSALGLGNLAGLAAPLFVRTFDIGKRRAHNDRGFASASPVLALLTTDDDTPRDWLSAGQAVAHVLLYAAAHEVSASFLNQPIEQLDFRPKMATFLGDRSCPQVLFRLGCSPRAKPASRRPVEMVLR